MDVYEAIKKRKSVRRYKDKDVEQEKLMKILEAARLAPSAANKQEWRFVVVQDKEKRQKLSEAARGQKFVAEAPVVIACCAETDFHEMPCGQLCYPIDVSIAIDHMTLIAVEEELGTCWIGAFYEDKVKSILNIKCRTRRTRRARLGYRSPRFNNRTRPEGWLAPSIQHRHDSHIRLVETLATLLPIPFKKIEVANFDTHKMQQPEITGLAYQQGTLQGYEVKEYLLDKWGRTCAYCGKTDVPLEVEHIIPKSRGGTDRVSNLTLSCRKCNLKKENKTAEEFGYPQLQHQATQPLKAPACLNTIRWKLVEQLGAEHTYGYITKYQRNKLGLEKSHVNDAFFIAGGTNQERCRPYEVIQVRRNNRSLQMNRKGFKPSIRKQRYQLQPNDLVTYDGKLYKVKGVFNYGTWVRLRDSQGAVVNANIKKVELLKYGKGLVFTFENNN